ncbi:MAG: formyl transferase [Armatimonadota bacterium]
MIDTNVGSAKSLIRLAKQEYAKHGLPGLCSRVWNKANKVLPLPHHQYEWQGVDYYRQFSPVVKTVENFNSPESEQLLRSMAPDLLILGGSRIIKSNILSIPKMGVINAHPGLLPKYRGVDVIPWAVLQGDSVGVTVHYVDVGVDTGRICRNEVVSLQKGDTFEVLARRVEQTAGRLMGSVVAELMENGKLSTIENVKQEGRLYKGMDKASYRQAKRQLAKRIGKECAG